MLDTINFWRGAAIMAWLSAAISILLGPEMPPPLWWMLLIAFILIGFFISLALLISHEKVVRQWAAEKEEIATRLDDIVKKFPPEIQIAVQPSLSQLKEISHVKHDSKKHGSH